MKPIFWVLLSLLLSPFILAIALYAGTDAAPVIDEWRYFLEAIKGSAGLNSFGLIIAVVQTLVVFMGNRFVKMPGKYKLLLVQALTMVTGVSMLKTQGFDWQSAFMHANTVGAFQVFFHQLLKQFREEKEPKIEIPLAK